MEYLRQMIENPALGKLMESAVNSWDDLNEDDKRTSNYLFIQLFRHWENMYYQHKLSVLDKRLWASHLNTMTGYFYHKGTQEWWRHRRMAFAEEFRCFLEKIEKPDIIYPTIKDLTNQTSEKD